VRSDHLRERTRTKAVNQMENSSGKNKVQGRYIWEGRTARKITLGLRFMRWGEGEEPDQEREKLAGREAEGKWGRDGNLHSYVGLGRDEIMPEVELTGAL